MRSYVAVAGRARRRLVSADDDLLALGLAVALRDLAATGLNQSGG
jgi:hypothetical protein